MKIIKTANFNKQAGPEMRFRGSIYVDVYVPMPEIKDNKDLDTTRELAREYARVKIQKYANQIPNSYVGGVGYLSKDSLELDKEI